MTQEVVRQLVGGEWVTKIADESGGGGGGSQPPTPFNTDSDPGAVGPGAIWTTLTDDPMKMYVRNAADDGWDQVQPSSLLLADMLGVNNDAGGYGITNAGEIDTAGGNIDMGTTGAIVNLADPSGDQDAATKKYVDDNGPFTPLQASYAGSLADLANSASAFCPLTLLVGSALLDLTTPDHPVFVAAGVYAVSVACECSDGLTGGGYASFRLTTEDTVTAAYNTPLSVFAPGNVGAVSVVSRVFAGARCEIFVTNGDGAAARDFTVAVLIVRLA